MRLAPLPFLLALSPAMLGCAGGTTSLGEPLTTLRLDLDPPIPVGAEIYQCRRFDLGGAKGKAIHALRWTPPSGGVRLHHAVLFAAQDPVAPGAVPCDPMPVPVAVLPLYAPGGEQVAFPEGVAIAVPEQATTFFVELHLFRFAAGADEGSVALFAGEGPAEHLAGWVDDTAPVPTILPHASVTSTDQCRFEGPGRIVGAWPHMHRLGARFQGAVVRADGRREPLVDVDPWDFDHQPLYPVDAALGEGDAVETACTWSNTTSGPVSGGPRSTDEMCNQGLVMWPLGSARCVR
jgi:hypothetical protein